MVIDYKEPPSTVSFDADEALKASFNYEITELPGAIRTKLVDARDLDEYVRLYTECSGGFSICAAFWTAYATVESMRNWLCLSMGILVSACVLIWGYRTKKAKARMTEKTRVVPTALLAAAIDKCRETKLVV